MNTTETNHDKNDVFLWLTVIKKSNLTPFQSEDSSGLKMGTKFLKYKIIGFQKPNFVILSKKRSH